MSKSRIFISASNNPWFNLAVEDCIFRSMSTDQRVLFLWRNTDTVVIGRAQNPWKECHTQKMEQDEVLLARRQSGGGAVFHDLGNTNFTFMAGKQEYNKLVSTNIVLSALKGLGIDGYANGRNDLVIGEGDEMRKFSGSAYRETSDRAFHHGTLLLKSDLSRLADYLNPDPKKLEAKGIRSVRSRVVNLNEINSDIDHELVCDAIVKKFCEYFGETPEIEFISPDEEPDLPEFHQKFHQQRSWNWNFGKTPKFMHSLEERFSWGGVELHFDVKDAIIGETQLFTDSLAPDPLELLCEKLKGTPYSPEHIGSCINDVIQLFPKQSEELLEVKQWITRVVA